MGGLHFNALAGGDPLRKERKERNGKCRDFTCNSKAHKISLVGKYPDKLYLSRN